MPISSTLSPRVARAIERGKVKAVVLTGGMGARMNSITDPKRHQFPVSKCVTPVGNRPLIDFSLRPLSDLGIREFHLAVYHLAESVRQVVGLGESYSPDTRVHYIVDSPSIPYDTAGAVARIVKEEGWDREEDAVVMVLSGDIVHNFDIGEALEAHFDNMEKHQAAGTIMVNPIPWSDISRFGTVRMEGMPKKSDFKKTVRFEEAVAAWLRDHEGAALKIEQFKEKATRGTALSNLNNSSVYLFSAPLFAELYPKLTRKFSGRPLFPELGPRRKAPHFFDFGMHVFKWLTEQAADRLPLFAFIHPTVVPGIVKTPSYWRDIGKGDELLQANMDVLDGKVDIGLGESQRYTKVSWGWRGDNVFVDPTAHINSSHPSIIGSNVVIHRGARVERCVIGPNTVIEEGASLCGSVIFPRPFGHDDPNSIGHGVQLINSVFAGGSVSARASFTRKLVYAPIGDVAVDSLFERTEIK